jgi:hypothetical protein
LARTEILEQVKRSRVLIVIRSCPTVIRECDRYRPASYELRSPAIGPSPGNMHVRLHIGEVRGIEARRLLGSFNTGHAGSLATIRAN